MSLTEFCLFTTTWMSGCLTTGLGVRLLSSLNRYKFQSYEINNLITATRNMDVYPHPLSIPLSFVHSSSSSSSLLRLLGNGILPIPGIKSHIIKILTPKDIVVYRWLDDQNKLQYSGLPKYRHIKLNPRRECVVSFDPTANMQWTGTATETATETTTMTADTANQVPKPKGVRIKTKFEYIKLPSQTELYLVGMYDNNNFNYHMSTNNGNELAKYLDTIVKSHKTHYTSSLIDFALLSSVFVVSATILKCI